MLGLWLTVALTIPKVPKVLQPHSSMVPFAKPTVQAVLHQKNHGRPASKEIAKSADLFQQSISNYAQHLLLLPDSDGCNWGNPVLSLSRATWV